MFFRKKPYDRSATLAAADKARGRGRVRKAITEYTKILKNDPADAQVHARIAPLLAKVKRWHEARTSFDAAGTGYLKAGFADKAIAVWNVAAQTFPEDVEYWERIANEQVRRGRRIDAVRSLLEGRQRLRSKRQRPFAVLLLRQVLTIQPLHVDATLELSALLARTGEREEAEKLLRDLQIHVTRRDLRRIRAAQFWPAPSVGRAWGWLTCH